VLEYGRLVTHLSAPVYKDDAIDLVFFHRKYLVPMPIGIFYGREL
jgi:hypothetical protein